MPNRPQTQDPLRKGRRDPLQTTPDDDEVLQPGQEREEEQLARPEEEGEEAEVDEDLDEEEDDDEDDDEDDTISPK